MSASIVFTMIIYQVQKKREIQLIPLNTEKSHIFCPAYTQSSNVRDAPICSTIKE